MGGKFTREVQVLGRPKKTKMGSLKMALGWLNDEGLAETQQQSVLEVSSKSILRRVTFNLVLRVCRRRLKT